MADSQFISHLTTRELQRFFSKVRVDRVRGCWDWTGATSGGEYGQVRVRNVQYRAHRLSHLAFVGAIPIGYDVDHLCFRPSCVNPAHLEAVTPAENSRRRRRAYFVHRADPPVTAPQRRDRGRCVRCYKLSETYRCAACRVLHNNQNRGRRR